MMNRTLYLLYYFKTTPKTKFKKFLNFVARKEKRSKILIISDIIKSCITYNISILDYFYFSFYTLDKLERRRWAGTGFMYEYQKKMNPLNKRDILENKIKFLKTYDEFIERSWVALDEFKNDYQKVDRILKNDSGLIVIKGAMGQVGSEVKVLNAKSYTYETLQKFMLKNKYDLLEEAIVQHPDLMTLSPSGLNTVRIITQLNKNNTIDILGARLRVSVNSSIDNMGAGNFAVVVEPSSGVVISNGIFQDITKEDIIKHPVTNTMLKGFQIPHWDKVLELIQRAAIKFPENKSIGWDVAIGENKVELIEGNHNWCKLLYQLPVKKGLKVELIKYL